MAHYKGGQTLAPLGSLGGKALVPSDSVDEPYYFRAIYVGGTGNVTVVCCDESSLLFQSVPAGFQILIHGKRIQETGTTATLLVGIW